MTHHFTADLPKVKRFLDSLIIVNENDCRQNTAELRRGLFAHVTWLKTHL